MLILICLQISFFIKYKRYMSKYTQGIGYIIVSFIVEEELVETLVTDI